MLCGDLHTRFWPHAKRSDARRRYIRSEETPHDNVSSTQGLSTTEFLLEEIPTTMTPWLTLTPPRGHRRLILHQIEALRREE